MYITLVLDHLMLRGSHRLAVDQKSTCVPEAQLACQEPDPDRAHGSEGGDAGSQVPSRGIPSPVQLTESRWHVGSISPLLTKRKGTVPFNLGSPWFKLDCSRSILNPMRGCSGFSKETFSDLQPTQQNAQRAALDHLLSGAAGGGWAWG